MDIGKKVDILGRSIDLDKIENPKLKRVMDRRLSDFMFSYGDDHKDHSEHTESKGRDKGGMSWIEKKLDKWAEDNKYRSGRDAYEETYHDAF